MAIQHEARRLTWSEKQENKSDFRAGIARADITPPVGIDLAGFYTRIQPSLAVYDPLTATALALESNNLRTILISCDLLSMREQVGENLRQRIAEAISVPPSHVLIACSHTHSGPILGAHLQTSLNSPTLTSYEQAYLANLGNTLAGLAMQAVGHLRPARLKVGTGHSDIGVNRREKLPSGRVVIGINKAGLRDPEVGVVRIDDALGSPLAVLVNYACHPIVLGPRNRYISADYPGTMRNTVEEATGALCLFLQGCAGDQGPSSGVDAGFGAVKRLGRCLGYEVARVYWSLDPRNVRRRRVIFESVAPLINVEEEILEDAPVTLNAIERTVPLPLSEAPNPTTAAEQRAALEANIEQMRRAGESPVEVSKAEIQVAWLNHILNLHSQSTVPDHIDALVQALRIGPIGIVALPVEPFVGIGLEIKKRSPAPFTAVVGYANACHGYVPSPEAYAEGGYEIENSFKLYRLPAPFTPEAYRALINTGQQVLKMLFQEPKA